MSDVNRLIEDVAMAIGSTGGWETRALAAIEAIGVPPETLAALKAGTMKAVPVPPTEKMAAPLCRLWLMADQKVTEADTQHALQYAAAVIAAAPAKPEDAE